MFDIFKEINPELTDEEINVNLNKLWQGIDDISEKQYRQFIESSVKRIKLNTFYK